MLHPSLLQSPPQPPLCKRFLELATSDYMWVQVSDWGPAAFYPHDYACARANNKEPISDDKAYFVPHNSCHDTYFSSYISENN